MAFDFLGTFREEEVRALLKFAEHQIKDVHAKMDSLRANLERGGWIDYSFDNEGNRVGYSVRPQNSLLSKYINAYHFHGGSVLDLGIRSRGNWVHLTKGTYEQDAEKPFQGNKIVGAESGSNLHYDDIEVGITVSQIKDWMIPTIKRKRENLEYQIRRVVDRVDQSLEEIILLVQRESGATTLEQLKDSIEFFLGEDDFHSAGKKDTRLR